MKLATEVTEHTEVVRKYKDYPESDLTEKIIQASIEVQKNLGHGFLESIYENALVVELEKMGLKYEKQKLVEIFYKNVKVGEHRVDLIVENRVITELKAISDFEQIHRAQIISYLTATGLRIGLLINFGKTKIDVDRIII